VLANDLSQPVRLGCIQRSPYCTVSVRQLLRIRVIHPILLPGFPIDAWISCDALLSFSSPLLCMLTAFYPGQGMVSPHPARLANQSAEYVMYARAGCMIQVLVVKLSRILRLDWLGMGFLLIRLCSGEIYGMEKVR
jgi:hypothetical protein